MKKSANLIYFFKYFCNSLILLYKKKFYYIFLNGVIYFYNKYNIKKIFFVITKFFIYTFNNFI